MSPSLGCHVPLGIQGTSQWHGAGLMAQGEHQRAGGLAGRGGGSQRNERGTLVSRAVGA